MDWIVALGAVSLGVVVGWLIRYFIRRFKRFTPQALTAVISAVAGGTAIKLLSTNEHAVWVYFFGLLVGFIAYHVVFVLERNREEAISSDSSDEVHDSKTSSSYSGDGPLFSRSGPRGQGTDKKL